LYDLTSRYDHGTQSDLILLYLAKAFDTVLHQQLMYKFSWYGICDQTLQWIKSFLIGHCKKVVVENTCSNKVPVISRVPQGTILDLSYFQCLLMTILTLLTQCCAFVCLWLYSLCNSCNMGIRDLSDMHTLSPRVTGPRAEGMHYISGKSWMHMFQVICITSKAWTS